MTDGRCLAILVYPPSSLVGGRFLCDGDQVPVFVASPAPEFLVHWDGAEFALDGYREPDGAAVYRQTRAAPAAGEVREDALDVVPAPAELAPNSVRLPGLEGAIDRYDALAALGADLILRHGELARGQGVATSTRAPGSRYVVTLEVRVADD